MLLYSLCWYISVRKVGWDISKCLSYFKQTITFSSRHSLEKNFDLLPASAHFGEHLIGQTYVAYTLLQTIWVIQILIHFPGNERSLFCQLWGCTHLLTLKLTDMDWLHQIHKCNRGSDLEYIYPPLSFHTLHIFHFDPIDHEWKCIFPCCKQRNIRPVSVSRLQHWRKCDSLYKAQSNW